MPIKIYRGFTLVELMVALIIVGVLVAIAIPSYQHHIRNTQQQDARVSLLSAAQGLEHYYLQHHSYAGATLREVGISDRSQQDYFRLSLQVQSAHQYLLSATSKSQGAHCIIYQLDAQQQLSKQTC